jgi:hypothetical protein
MMKEEEEGKWAIPKKRRVMGKWIGYIEIK